MTFQSELKIAVDKLLVGAPGSGFGAEACFGIFFRNGRARVALRGDFIADGAVKAESIDIRPGGLSAISADCGTITAGVIRSDNGKLTIDLNANEIRMLD